jgi:DNA-binding FadR family transcriptional regulator
VSEIHQKPLRKSPAKSPAFGPIARRKLSHEIVDRLLARISSGAFAAGDPLPSERELTAQFGVGRPAVREAMQTLERMGLISISHGERARVVAPTPQSIIEQIGLAARHLLATSPGTLEDLKQARLFFEVGMVRLAAEKATAEDVARLRKRLAEQKAAAKPGPDGLRKDLFLEKDMAFHREIASISGNSVLSAVSDSMLDWLATFHTGLLRVRGAEQLTLDEHAAILDRIAANDPAGAVEAMTRHLSRASDLYRQFERPQAEGG